MKKGPSIIFLLVSGLWSLVSNKGLSADTIYTSDGRELKGIVVEDYKDRIVLSTPDGETMIMKKDIRELYFDSEEENLLKLAEQAREGRDYVKAFAFFDKAFKLNPNSKAAKDGLVLLQGYLFRQEQTKKEYEIKRYEELERYRGGIKNEETKEEPIEKLKKKTGMALAVKGVFPIIEDVKIDSPAYQAGIEKGDYLVAVWGRLTGYATLNEIIDFLLEKSSLEIKCTIERTAIVGLNPDRRIARSANELVGASFAMEFDGLTVESVKEGSYSYDAGMKKGDIVTAIDGRSTRYMPIKEALDSIRRSKNESVALTLRREALIWRRE